MLHIGTYQLLLFSIERGHGRVQRPQIGAGFFTVFTQLLCSHGTYNVLPPPCCTGEADQNLWASQCYTKCMRAQTERSLQQRRRRQRSLQRRRRRRQSLRQRRRRSARPSRPDEARRTNAGCRSNKGDRVRDAVPSWSTRGALTSSSAGRVCAQSHESHGRHAVLPSAALRSNTQPASSRKRHGNRGSYVQRGSGKSAAVSAQQEELSVTRSVRADGAARHRRFLLSRASSVAHLFRGVVAKVDVSREDLSKARPIVLPCKLTRSVLFVLVTKVK